MITAINRSFVGYPNIVHISTTDNLATITTTGYFSSQLNQIELLNNGTWQWEIDDIVVIYYATNLINWFQYVASTDSFSAIPPPAGISTTLPSAEIIVGNSSNVATAVAMSGDVHISNTGATTIQPGAVSGSKIAANTVDYANIALDVAATATVALTAAQIKALYDTPVQLIAAPGSGNLIIIDSILWDIAYSTAQYTGGGVLAAQYGNTVHGAGAVASGTLAAASLNGVAASGFLSMGGISGSLNVAASSSLNTAVYLSNQTADFATGSSTATLYIRYRILTPA